MKKKIVGAVILFGVIIIAAGCAGSVSIPREELDGRNMIDVIFAEHSSARVVSHYYGLEGEEFSQTTVYMKKDGVVSLHTSFSFGAGYTVEPGEVYFYEEDGSYGKYAFFDDGYFETYYLPYITNRLLYVPIEGNTFVSDSVKGNIRTLVYNADIANVEFTWLYGIYSGVLETTYEYDAKTGFQLSESYIAITDGESRLLSERIMTYGQDDDLPEPEYLTRTKNTSDARTVRFIMQDGRTFTHIVSKEARIIPLSLEYYEYFEDPECTVMYSRPDGEYPAETVIYVKEP